MRIHKVKEINNFINLYEVDNLYFIDHVTIKYNNSSFIEFKDSITKLPYITFIWLSGREYHYNKIISFKRNKRIVDSTIYYIGDELALMEFLGDIGG